MPYIECGQIVKPQGIKGEVKVYPWCDEPDFILDFKTLYLGKEKTPIKIKSGRVQNAMVILKLDGVDTVEDAQKLRNTVLYIDRNDADLEEGQCFICEMLGMEVYDADTNKLYGKMVDFSQTGANNVYHIEFENGKVYLIPAIKDVIIKTDIDENKMFIRPLNGLFSDDDGECDDKDWYCNIVSRNVRNSA